MRLSFLVILTLVAMLAVGTVSADSPTQTMPTVRIIEEYILDSTPRVGARDVTVKRFKVTTGSVTDVVFQMAQVGIRGTLGQAGLHDKTINIELVSTAKGLSVAVFPQWVEGGASWQNLGILVPKGHTEHFGIQLDVVGGSGHNVGTKLVDVEITTIDERPVNVIWERIETPYQTIQSGSMTIVSSPSTESFTLVAGGRNQKIGEVQFCAKGEAQKISPIPLSFGFIRMEPGELEQVRLIDSYTGAIWAGPRDITPAGHFQGSIVFHTTFLAKVGCVNLDLIADVADTVSPGDKVAVAIQPQDVGVRGLVTKDAITPSSAAKTLILGETTVAASQEFVYSVGRIFEIVREIQIPGDKPNEVHTAYLKGVVTCNLPEQTCLSEYTFDKPKPKFLFQPISKERVSTTTLAVVGENLPPEAQAVEMAIAHPKGMTILRSYCGDITGAVVRETETTTIVGCFLDFEGLLRFEFEAPNLTDGQYEIGFEAENPFRARLVSLDSPNVLPDITQTIQFWVRGGAISFKPE